MLELPENKPVPGFPGHNQAEAPVHAANVSNAPRLSRLWLAVYSIVLVFTALLVVETALRIPFPWDFYQWSESPFLTDMMKLDQHQPLYTNPADSNSFVYSPGLQYICYAVLKPFGLELDIRWDRLVSTLLGLLGAGFGALTVRRLLLTQVPLAQTKLFFVVTWCVIWQVLSKNFMADVPHPDNLHALHALLTLYLTWVAVESKKFSAALGVMVWTGLGIFTKQTEALSLVGPLAAFAVCRTWSLGRWLLLAAVGAGILLVSAVVLLSPEPARFWTLQLLTSHRIWPSKFYWIIYEWLVADRAVLSCLAVGALVYLWTAGHVLRRYVQVWFCVGVFTVLPNVSAYVKVNGTWNNLIIFQIWLIVLVWPFFTLLTAGESPSAPAAVANPDAPLFRRSQIALMLLFLLMLLPIKTPPRAADLAFGRQVDDAIRADVSAGRKVLLSHGTEPLLHAGIKEAPLDRSVSISEMADGHRADLSGMKARIESHYYDRIYLLYGDLYEPGLLDCIHQYYEVERSIPRSTNPGRLVCGFGDVMHSDVTILLPRQTGGPLAR